MYLKYKTICLLKKDSRISEYIYLRDLSPQDKSQAKYILDIQRSAQNGLTIRTIESMAYGIKLITTNNDVKKYVFYHPQNILIIDRLNVVIPDLFINSDCERIDDKISSKYSLESWV